MGERFLLISEKEIGMKTRIGFIIICYFNAGFSLCYTKPIFMLLDGDLGHIFSQILYQVMFNGVHCLMLLRRIFYSFTITPLQNPNLTIYSEVAIQKDIICIQTYLIALFISILFVVDEWTLSFFGLLGIILFYHMGLPKDALAVFHWDLLLLEFLQCLC